MRIYRNSNILPNCYLNNKRICKVRRPYIDTTVFGTDEYVTKSCRSVIVNGASNIRESISDIDDLWPDELPILTVSATNAGKIWSSYNAYTFTWTNSNALEIFRENCHLDLPMSFYGIEYGNANNTTNIGVENLTPGKAYTLLVLSKAANVTSISVANGNLVYGIKSNPIGSNFDQMNPGSNSWNIGTNPLVVKWVIRADSNGKVIVRYGGKTRFYIFTIAATQELL